jgi:hypothetical protein
VAVVYPYDEPSSHDISISYLISVLYGQATAYVFCIHTAMHIILVMRPFEGRSRTNLNPLLGTKNAV